MSTAPSRVVRPPLRRTIHNQIVTLIANCPEPLTATLMFGVGIRDEPATLGGVTHLAEHLLFRKMGDLHVVHDGVTSASDLEFIAVGETEDVVAFLHTLAGAIATPTFSDQEVAMEREVIALESPSSMRHQASLLTHQFGFSGLGKSSAGVATLGALSGENVHDWIRTWLVGRNARLVLSGPPDQTGRVLDLLTLRLPDGDAPLRNLSEDRSSAPIIVPSTKDGVAGSLLVEAWASPALQAALDREFSTWLRDRHALIYTARIFGTRVDAAQAVIEFVLDNREDTTARVLELTVELMKRIQNDGFSTSARLAALTERRTALRTTAGPYADAVASCELLGVAILTPEEEIAKLDALDGTELATLVDFESLQLAFPEDAELDVRDASIHGMQVEDRSLWRPVPEQPTKEGRSWWGRRSLRGHRLKMSGETLWLSDHDEVRRLNLRDLVLVGIFEDGSLALVDERGRDDVLDPADWWRGASLVASVLERTPERMRLDYRWHSNETPTFEPIPLP